MSANLNLIFVSSHRRHRKVADRLVGAVAAHRNIELLSFDRGSVDHPIYSDPAVTHNSLGPIDNGVSLSRLWALARALRVLRGVRARVSQGDTLVLANTFELLVLCWLSGLTRFPTIYDVADIHTLLLKRSWIGRGARWIERRALRHARLLIVSSPWFYWEYFLRWQRSDHAAVLIENRVEFRPRAADAQRAFTRRIAWNGLLRCQRSAAVLLECLTESPDALELSLHGTLERLGQFGPELSAQPHCRYTGEYDPPALLSLLAESSFVWGVDFADDENSTWLLPNRLYESIAAGIPLIAVADSATGEVVRRYDIGMVLPACTPQALTQALRACSQEQYQRWLANIDALQARAVRRSEWTAVFAAQARWGALRFLPRAVDVGAVLAT